MDAKMNETMTHPLATLQHTLAQDRSAPSPLPDYWLLGVLLAGFFLRFHDLGRQGFWLDEAFTWSAVTAPWREVWGMLQQFSDVSPMSYVLIKLGAPFLGVSEFGLRAVSAWAGWLAIPVTYRLGRAMLGRAEGVIAAAFIAFSPFALWQARDARPYSFYLLFAALVLWGFWRVVRSDRRRGWRMLIVASMAFYLTHYVSALYAYGQAVYSLAHIRRRPLLFRQWFLAQAIAVPPVIVWVLTYLAQRHLLSANWWIPHPTLLTPFQTVWNFYTGDATHWTLLMVVGVAALIALMARGALKRWPAESVQLLWWWLLLPPLTAWLFSLRLPSYVDRYFEPGMVAMALLLAAGLTSLPRYWRTAAASLTVVGLLIGATRLFTDPIFLKQDWRGAARLIEAEGLPVGLTDPQPLLSLSPYSSPQVKFGLARTEAELSARLAEGPFILPIGSPVKNESAHNLSKPIPFDPLTEGPDFFVRWQAAHPDVRMEVRPFVGLALVVIGR